MSQVPSAPPVTGFDLHIPFEHGQSPQACLDSYFEQQTFKSNADGNVDLETYRLEKKWIKYLPETLMIHAQGGITQFNLRSHPTLAVNEKHSNEVSTTGVEYILGGAICHVRGHYIAYVLDQESKRWVYVNDLNEDLVVLENPVTEGNLNMLIYQKAQANEAAAGAVAAAAAAAITPRKCNNEGNADVATPSSVSPLKRATREAAGMATKAAAEEAKGSVVAVAAVAAIAAGAATGLVTVARSTSPTAGRVSKGDEPPTAASSVSTGTSPAAASRATNQPAPLVPAACSPIGGAVQGAKQANKQSGEDAKRGRGRPRKTTDNSGGAVITCPLAEPEVICSPQAAHCPRCNVLYCLRHALVSQHRCPTSLKPAVGTLASSTLGKVASAVLTSIKRHFGGISGRVAAREGTGTGGTQARLKGRSNRGAAATTSYHNPKAAAECEIVDDVPHGGPVSRCTVCVRLICSEHMANHLRRAHDRDTNGKLLPPKDRDKGGGPPAAENGDNKAANGGASRRGAPPSPAAPPKPTRPNQAALRTLRHAPFPTCTQRTVPPRTVNMARS